MSKTRIDVWVNPDVFVRVLQFQAEKGKKNTSQAVQDIIKGYFNFEVLQDEAINRLNRLVIKRDKEIQELKHQIRHMELKEIDKHED